MAKRKTCADDGCTIEFGLFHWRHACIGCGAEFCSKHCKKRSGQNYSGGLKEGKGFCKVCGPIFTAAVRRQAKIEIWSKRYKGHVPVDETKETKRIRSDWNRDWKDSEKELRICAAYYGFDIVHMVSRSERTESEPSNRGKGRHYYTTWRVSGIAAYRMAK